MANGLALSCGSTDDQLASYGSDCTVETRDGGISRLIFLSAFATFNNGGPVDYSSVGGDASVTTGESEDAAQWAALQTGGLLHVSPLGVGEKTETDKTKLRLVSCKAEKTVGFTHSISFTTYNMESTPANIGNEFKFWSEVSKKSDKFTVMYVGCDNLIYLDFSEYTLATTTGGAAAKNPGFPYEADVDHIIPDNADDPQSFTVTLQIQENDLIRPLDGTTSAAILAALGL